MVWRCILTRHTLTTLAIMGVLIVAAIVVRAFVLAGAGWIDTRTPTGALIQGAFVVIPALYVAVRIWRAVRPTHTRRERR